MTSARVKVNPWLRPVMGLRNCSEDLNQRMLNALEPGTVVAIHRRVAKDECFVVLRGKVRVTTHNDDGSVIEDVVLRQEIGNYGVDIPKNVCRLLRMCWLVVFGLWCGLVVR